MIKSGIR